MVAPLVLGKLSRLASFVTSRRSGSEEGRETMVKTARTNPAVFFATCARLIPNDVKLTVDSSYPAI